jgi:hypothetical protein
VSRIYKKQISKVNKKNGLRPKYNEGGTARRAHQTGSKIMAPWLDRGVEGSVVLSDSQAF